MLKQIILFTGIIFNSGAWAQHHAHQMLDYSSAVATRAIVTKKKLHLAETLKSLSVQIEKHQNNSSVEVNQIIWSSFASDLAVDEIRLQYWLSEEAQKAGTCSLKLNIVKSKALALEENIHKMDTVEQGMALFTIEFVKSLNTLQVQVNEIATTGQYNAEIKDNFNFVAQQFKALGLAWQDYDRRKNNVFVEHTNIDFEAWVVRHTPVE